MEAAINPTRRGFFGHAAGAYYALGAATLLVAADPIFDLIAVHRELYDVSYEWPDEDEAGYTAAAERCMTAMHTFVRTVPTTDAGMIAYLDHLESFKVFGGNEPNADDICAISETVRQFVKARAA